MSQQNQKTQLPPEIISKILEINKIKKSGTGTNYVPPWDQRTNKPPPPPPPLPITPQTASLVQAITKKEEKKRTGKIGKAKNLASNFMAVTPTYNPTVQIQDAIKTLSDDRLDGFLAIFAPEILKFERQERASKFVEVALPSILEKAPLIEKALNQYVQSLAIASDPKSIFPQFSTPIVFINSSTELIAHKVMQLSTTGFDIIPPKTVDSDMYIIAQVSTPFISTKPRFPIKVNDIEIVPGSFGCHGVYIYYINSIRKPNQTYHIQFPVQFNDSICIASFYYLRRKPNENIIHDFYGSLKGLVAPSDLFFKSRNKRCSSCRPFRVIDVVESTMQTGTCRCPTCNTELQFSEISLDSSEEMQKNDLEIKKAREQMCNSINMLVKTNLVDDTWTGNLFNGEPGLANDEDKDNNQFFLPEDIDSYLAKYDKIFAED
ncbi:hypothetical protein TVAG_105710 [Trichomonas vaginalis G3]|uniref:Uncharacterized protein n=1 Tax=Trichomonas vaginalis (strain ATCC PRA-98 / G3) TaxID=412133 RepID=A2FLR0_TRIV3|nr:hypothetical protein TVAGG3_0515380 [Trichomonas vaginalis G3]EAX94152.1 hypothetical protein TVAG_105710 [Trichomonas vaginalis G3]KAI5518081.1 hypothetical protein TVAGG3_0515380 [Trichomonas vaginalis G3]|eukprot:XP_001307082.1 hypothetical protein [Trichomonas vaginalis G3]